MPVNPYTAQAQDLAARLPPTRQRTIDNTELRVIFGVSRVTSLQRDEIVRALQQAGLEVVSGALGPPLVVRNPAVERVAADRARPWFKLKRTWALAGVLLFLLIGVLGSESDPASETSQQANRTATDTTTTTTPGLTADAPTRSELAAMIDGDRYSEAVAGGALLGSDEARYVARRIANRLARRVMSALDRGDRSRARFLVARFQDYPSTAMSQAATTAYEAARTRARARAAARRAEAQRIIQEAAAREAAERAAESPDDVPDVGVPDVPSGPSTTNWCGKRDGDGDGIYCE